MFKRLFKKNANVLTAEEKKKREFDLRLAMQISGYVPPPPKVVFSEAEKHLADLEMQQAKEWRKSTKSRKDWSYLQIAVEENFIYLFKYSLACEKHKYKNRTYYLADAMVLAAEWGRCHMLELLVQDHHFVHIAGIIRAEVFQRYAAAGLIAAWPPMEVLILEQAIKQRREIVGQKGQVEANLLNAIENRDSPRIELLVNYYAMFYNINDFKSAKTVFTRDNKTKIYNVDDIKPFLKHGLDISGFQYIRSRGWPADIIFMACGRDGDPLLRFFLDHNVSPHATGSYRFAEQWSPLHECAVKGFSESVALLLERGANANTRCQNGDTPLHSIAAPFIETHPFSNKHLEIVKMLIKHGADVNTRNERSGWTPYALACFRDKRDLMDLLVANGARTDVKDNNGETPQERINRERHSNDMFQQALAKAEADCQARCLTSLGV